MLVRNWMKHPVHSVKPLDNIRHARALLEEHRFNQLPVVVDGKLVGIITDRDLRDAFPSVFDAARNRESSDPEKITVESVMTHDVTVLAPADSVVDAARLMRKQRIGAVPVVDHGKLVGILTRSDLLDALVTASSDSEPVS